MIVEEKDEEAGHAQYADAQNLQVTSLFAQRRRRRMEMEVEIEIEMEVEMEMKIMKIRGEVKS